MKRPTIDMKPDNAMVENSRQNLRQLLGGFPRSHATLLKRTERAELPQTRVEELTLELSSGRLVRAFLTGPNREWRNLPAVLYCHAHGNRYAVGADELILGRPALLPVPYGQALAEQGMIALCMDMPCFGLRSDQLENELSKRLLYRGQTLFGQMLAELGGALDFLLDLDGVDPNRIGVFGFSMGASHAFWLAALEVKIRACVHACAFADLATLVDSKAHDLHGIYMTVPGLLQHFSTGEIAGLIAPRPQLMCAGALDPLTPDAALRIAQETVETAYAKSAAAHTFSSFISFETGHVETPEMRQAVLDFLQRWL